MADDADINIKITANEPEFNATTWQKEFLENLETAKKEAEDLGAASESAFKKAAKGAKDAEDSHKKLNLATAGTTREFIVLGHETLTGNFSRIPGSLMVLAERMGGLHKVFEGITISTVAWTVAIGASLYAVYEMVAASERLAETQQTIRGAMELTGQSIYYNKEVVNQDIERLRVLADVSKSTSEEIAVSFARSGAVSQELKEKLIALVGDYAAATGKEAPKAAEDLLKMFEEPAKGANNLAKTLTGILTPAQEKQIEAFSRNGQKMEAQKALFDALSSKIDDFRINHLTPLQVGLEDIRDIWVAITSADFKGAMALPGGRDSVGRYQQTFKPAPQNTNDIDPRLEKEIEYNKQMREGNELEKQMGLYQSRRNDLIEKEVALRTAAQAAANSGDRESQKRFIADAEEVQQQINALKEKGALQAKRRMEEQARAEMEYSTHTMNMVDIQTQHELAIGKISSEQAIERELQTSYAKEQIMEEYYQKKRIAEKGDAAAQARTDAEFQRNSAKFAEEQQRLRNKSSEESIKSYRHMFDSMTTGFQTMTEKLIRGTSTFRDAFKTMCGDLVVEFAKMQVANIAKMLWASMVGKGITAADTLFTRNAKAAEAAASTYASVSAIPAVGWLMAPVAAAAAYAGVMAFGLPSAAGGWAEVPQDGLAMIHKKEMVLPAPLAERVRNMTDSGNSGNNISINISAVDAASVKDLFMKHGSSLMASINNQARNFNPHAMAMK